MTPPAPHARLAHLDLLFVKPLETERRARSRAGARRALAVAAAASAVAAALVLPSHSPFAPLPDWRGATAAVEARTRPEDLLVFATPDAEDAWMRYALRADDRRVATSPDLRDALGMRRRAWVVSAELRGADADGAAPSVPGWRAVDRVRARGVRATLLERRGEP